MPNKYFSIDDWRELERKGKNLPEDAIVTCGMKPCHKEVNPEKRTVEFALSDDGLDRDEDTVNVEGWELDDYRANPVVLFGHQSKAMGGVIPVIGKSLEIGPATIQGKRVLRTLDEFMPREMSEFADSVFQMLKHNFLNAVSAGFRIHEYTFVEDRGPYGGFNILRQELFEHSVVPVPSNPNALAVRGKEAGINMAPLVEWCEQYLDAEKDGLHIWIPREHVETQWSAIKETEGRGVSTICTIGLDPAMEATENRPEANVVVSYSDHSTEVKEPESPEAPESPVSGEPETTPKDTDKKETEEPGGAEPLDTGGKGEDTKEDMKLELSVPPEIADRIKAGEEGEIKISFESTAPPSGDGAMTIFLDEECEENKEHGEGAVLLLDGVESVSEIAASVVGEVSKELDKQRMAQTGQLPEEV